MTDPIALFAAIRRPRLLLQAARIGLAEYRRDRDLRRLTGLASGATPRAALLTLLEAEAEAEQTRETGDANYSVSRHVEILIALMAEARLFACQPAQRLTE